MRNNLVNLFLFNLYFLKGYEKNMIRKIFPILVVHLNINNFPILLANKIKITLITKNLFYPYSFFLNENKFGFFKKNSIRINLENYSFYLLFLRV